MDKPEKENKIKRFVIRMSIDEWNELVDLCNLINAKRSAGSIIRELLHKKYIELLNKSI